MIVNVRQGKLKGLKEKSVINGKEYYAFLGIPYAKPPIGDLRFREPQPMEKWYGIRDALTEGPPCIQKTPSEDKYFGSEDCLYMNVFTPTPLSKDAAPKAVMVYIHRGEYTYGTGTTGLQSPDYLMEYDIVLVTLTYRLHVLGFLNMGTAQNVGNCGLRDQWFALKWISANIAAFGGDPKNVTIFGGASIHCHMVSPMSKDLFHKAIIQDEKLYQNVKRVICPRNAGITLAHEFGCTQSNPKKVVEFLRKQPAIELCEKYAQICAKTKIKTNGLMTYTLIPSIEVDRENAFLPDTVSNLKKTASPVPLMVGIIRKSGHKTSCHKISKQLEQYNFHCTTTTQNASQILSTSLLETYYTEDWFRNFYKSFNFVTNSEAPVYIYEFSFQGRLNFYETSVSDKIVTYPGELPYLFYPKKLIRNIETLKEPEKTVIQNVCTLWTNFAKTGNPTENFINIDWKPFTTEDPHYMQIDAELKLIEDCKRMLLRAPSNMSASINAVVNVEQGLLMGFRERSIFNGEEYYAFYGIPYAKPPVGHLRFKAPQPMEKWNQIRYATHRGSCCMQMYSFHKPIFIGDEDCLYLNIFTPAPLPTNAAVIVFIHGGNLMVGSGTDDIYSPDYLIRKGIVLVTMSFRLHVLGFLNMDTENSVDNCGLRDQWSALKWINENIRQFGGDPHNVTIFGGSSVHCHMVSPMSKGLFHKAIVLGESSYMDFTRCVPRSTIGFKLAKKMGCFETDAEKVVEFLRTRTTEDLCYGASIIDAEEQNKTKKKSARYTFIPSVEINKTNAFLPDTIPNLRKTATPVPLIVGIIAKNEVKLKMRERSSLSESARAASLEDSLQRFRCSATKVCIEKWLNNLYETFEYVAKADVPVYVYDFAFHGEMNMYKNSYLQSCEYEREMNVPLFYPGELPYLFYPKRLIPQIIEFEEPDKTVIKNMCSLFTNFAKTGNPNITFRTNIWRTFLMDRPRYLEIKNTLKLRQRRFNANDFKFLLHLCYCESD